MCLVNLLLTQLGGPRHRFVVRPNYGGKPLAGGDDPGAYSGMNYSYRHLPVPFRITDSVGGVSFPLAKRGSDTNTGFRNAHTYYR